MEESILWQIILQVVLIISNAIFACAEIAVISVNGAKLDQLTAQGDARAGRLKRLTDNPATFLATIQVAITLSGSSLRSSSRSACRSPRRLSALSRSS